MPLQGRINFTPRGPLVAALLSVTLLAWGDDDGTSGSRTLCAAVNTAELEDIWGDVSASEVGGLCSILVADGKSVFLEVARATGQQGAAQLLDGVVGAEEGEPVEIGDEALAFTGTSAGDVYVVRVGDDWFKLSAVGLPLGQLEATARSIADNW